MSGSHFYLTLPSNSSLNIFPDNKTTSYRVKLPQAIDLNGDWEVGLYSISYPITWYTLQNHENHIYYSKDGLIFQTAIVDYGYFGTMADLVKSVNAALKRNTGNDNIRLTYNARTEKVTVHVKNSHQLVLMGRLSIILGFGGEEIKITKTTTSPYVADLNGTAMIYFYCDIVQPQVVGDTNAKLIKSVPVQGKMGEVVAKTFTNIQYVTVQTKSFEDIEIILRDDTGRPVPFERGKVLVTLHFKQQSSSYFA